MYSMPESEARFFHALSKILGSQYLKAKSIGGKVSSNDVFLEKDFEQYDFPENVKSMLSRLLKELRSTGSVGKGSLSHHVDGLLVDHPKFGNRIIEFDEVQHFNTFRAVCLRQLSNHIDLGHLAYYEKYCDDLTCFNEMLRKHRLKAVVKSVPETIESLIDLVQKNATSNSGYTKTKTGFNYAGGRIAQRAYYDTLRDVAHLSPKNQSLAPPLRVAAFEFEDETGRALSQITQNQLQALIEHRLALTD